MEANNTNSLTTDSLDEHKRGMAAGFVANRSLEEERQGGSDEGAEGTPRAHRQINEGGPSSARGEAGEFETSAFLGEGDDGGPSAEKCAQ